MKRLPLLVVILVLDSGPARGRLQAVPVPDDAVCIHTVTGYFEFDLLDSDGSEITWSGEHAKDCDGKKIRYTLSGGPYCPNGIYTDDACAAQALWDQIPTPQFHPGQWVYE